MIVLNGNPHDNEAARTVVAALALLGLQPDARGVAVAIDGEVISRSGWHTFEIPDGAHVEVLTAMQGG
jgi:sulfur carrier protein